MSIKRATSRVLVIDDEPDIRDIVCAHVDFLGFESDQAANGRIALEMLQANEYDVIISDLSMPELTGMQLLSKLMEYGSAIPFVFLSAYSNSNLTLEALKLGAFDYLEKPFDAGDFRILIREAMRVSKERQRISGISGKIEIPGGKESAVLQVADAKRAELEIQKIGTLNEGAEKLKKTDSESIGTTLSKVDRLKLKFSEEALAQLVYLENALINLGQSDNCAWELGYGFRVMRGISNAGKALKENEIARLADAFERAFSFFRVRESMLTTEKMIEICESNKVLQLMIESLVESEFGQLNSELVEKAKKITQGLKEMTLDRAS